MSLLQIQRKVLNISKSKQFHKIFKLNKLSNVYIGYICVHPLYLHTQSSKSFFDYSDKNSTILKLFECVFFGFTFSSSVRFFQVLNTRIRCLIYKYLFNYFFFSRRKSLKTYLKKIENRKSDDFSSHLF